MLPCIRLTAQSVYSLAFNDIDGKTSSLQPYAGKKILVIVLSGITPDSIASQVRAFKSHYGSSVQVIGVLSAEDGVTEADKVRLRQSFSGIDIVLTGILRTHKGNQQSLLLQWLTNRKENTHFDRDVTGSGQKFFISENGKLYAVIGPEKRLDAPIIAKIVKANVN